MSTLSRRAALLKEIEAVLLPGTSAKSKDNLCAPPEAATTGNPIRRWHKSNGTICHTSLHNCTYSVSDHVDTPPAEAATREEKRCGYDYWDAAPAGQRWNDSWVCGVRESLHGYITQHKFFTPPAASDAPAPKWCECHPGSGTAHCPVHAAPAADARWDHIEGGRFVPCEKDPSTCELETSHEPSMTAPAADPRPSEYRSQGSESPTRPAERSSTTAPADGGEAPEQMGEERCDFVMYPAPDMPGWSPIVCRRNRAQHDEAEMLRDISHPFTPGQRAGKWEGE